MRQASDVVIVGSGIAGLYAALCLSSSFNIKILTKSKITDSNSYLAQGGIAAAVERDDDTLDEYMNDTMRAGAGVCDYQALKIMLKESVDNIEMLIKLGAEFDQNEGKLALTREAGHSKPRILHIDGDATGKGIMDVLIRRVYERPNIEIIENSYCFELLKKDKRCVGVKTIENNKLCQYLSKAVILAAGGVGQIYGITTNASTISGDAIAMAEKAGAEIEDMEFIQFHPTVFHHQEMKRFLISEAVRGEGGVLKNIHGERFMKNYNFQEELAPRDIVARAIIAEMRKTGTNHVFLDLTHLNGEYIIKRFPNIYAKCLEYGIDITKQMIPVSPAQHYLMGGIKTDVWGRTNIVGLYACGENACTGVHGANRLASNSLLEALVFSRRVAQELRRVIPMETYQLSMSEECKNLPVPLKIEPDVVMEARNTLQYIMRSYAGIIRSKAGLKIGLQKLLALEASLSNIKGSNQELSECRNMLAVAMLIIKQAIMREKSLGAHFLSEEEEKA